MKDHSYLVLAGLIVLAMLGDLTLNHAKGTLFMIQELITLQEYVQFWR